MRRQRGEKPKIAVDKTPSLCYDVQADNEHGLPLAGVAQPVEQLICNQQVGGSNPSTSSIALKGDTTTEYGGVPEWPKGADCKSVA